MWLAYNMNLLMISGDRTVSSGRKGAFYYTLEELSKHFDHIDIICPRSSYKLPATSYQLFKNVFFHPSPHNLWYQPFWILKKGKELLKNAKSIHEWVMTVHEYPPFYNGIGARWLSRAMYIPYAVEIHHIVGYPFTASLQEWIGRWMYHLPFFFKATVRGANKVRTVNNEVEKILTQWGVPQGKIEIIPSLYLDASALTPDPSIEKEYDVVCCARLVANKGLFEVLEAISLLGASTPAPAFAKASAGRQHDRLLIIGDGPERVNLEEKAKSLGIRDRVTFTGWLPEQKDVYREVQRGKIFVMHSRSEGNPRIAVEAMALGMPVIATRVGIMPQFGSDGDFVQFVDGSPQDLAAKIHDLLRDEKKAHAMGERARKEVLARFIPGEAVKNYARFLKNLASAKKLSLLFITQKLHEQDTFVTLWVRAFMRRGYEVIVLCLEKNISPGDFKVVSMGKEQGHGRLSQICSFYKHIFSLSYDRVFIHMSPIWYTLGFKWWLLKGTPVYLWYTHYKMQLGVWLFGIFGKRFFCATAQSLPQYEGSPKKIVTGHGIDLDFWEKRENATSNPYELLVVHRLSRSKRVEIGIRALALLPEKYTMVIYGIEAEPEYVMELRTLTKNLHLEHRVHFKGTIPMKELSKVYASHHLILNMASETIDKTMLEAMIYGCYPVTTKRNAEAIGLPAAPAEDSAESVASFIQNFRGADPEELYRLVKEGHSLDGLMEVMDGYIAKGI